MKKTRKILAVALFLLLMLTPVVSVSQPVTVQAAAKTTLKKSGGRYYAYENGKKLCNAWRKIKSGKVSYTYYFGANGAAYQADKEAQAAAAVKEMMRNAEAKAAVNAEEIMHHAENQCAVLRARAETRLDAAADSIVERIVID